MVVFASPASDRAIKTIAAAYDPKNDDWRELAATPFSVLTASPVWTGTRIVAFGEAFTGESPEGRYPEATAAAAYDPMTDRWSRLPDQPPGETANAFLPTVVWTGREVLIVGSRGDVGTARLGGVALDVRSRKWRRLPPSPLTGRSLMAGAWTGSELLVLGRRHRFHPSTSPSPTALATAHPAELRLLQGARCGYRRGRPRTPGRGPRGVRRRRSRPPLSAASRATPPGR